MIRPEFESRPSMGLMIRLHQDFARHFRLLGSCGRSDKHTDRLIHFRAGDGRPSNGLRIELVDRTVMNSESIALQRGL